MARVNVEIVKRSDHAKGFVVLPKRWVVERTFAWLGRCRRLAKDWENLNRKALAFLRLASIRLMLRKLTVGNCIARLVAIPAQRTACHFAATLCRLK
jgi:Transposase DDE domain